MTDHPQPADLTALSFYTEWDNGVIVGRCVEFPNLNCMARTRPSALAGITEIVSKAMEDVARGV